MCEIVFMFVCKRLGLISDGAPEKQYKTKTKE